jgi:hypothetical protein
MHRNTLIALMAGVILLALATLPPVLPGSTTVSLFRSAHAEKAPTTNAINLNSSRSNIYRKKKQTGNTKSTKSKRLNPQPEPPGSKSK